MPGHSEQDPSFVVPHLSGIMSPPEFEALRACLGNLGCGDRVQLRPATPEEQPWTPDGFDKSLLEHVPGNGHAVSAKALKAFAFSSFDLAAERVSQSAFEQRTGVAFKSLARHVEAEHIKPAQSERACRCPLRGFQESHTVRGTRRGRYTGSYDRTTTYLEPSSLVTAFDHPAKPIMRIRHINNAYTRAELVDFEAGELGLVHFAPVYAVVSRYVDALKNTRRPEV